MTNFQKMVPLVSVALVIITIFSGCKSSPTKISGELGLLQGHWEGKGAGGDCSITISGDALEYHAGEVWYKATIKLITNTHPKQLHATIIDCGQHKESIGDTVYVLYKLEDESLILTTFGDIDDPPLNFSPNNLYEVKKVEPIK